MKMIDSLKESARSIIAETSEVSVTDAAPANNEGMFSVATDKARMFMPMTELVNL